MACACPENGKGRRLGIIGTAGRQSDNMVAMRVRLALLLSVLGSVLGLLDMPAAFAAGPQPAVTLPEGAASGLFLRCTPDDSEVFIDGDSIGKTPLGKVYPLKVGEHTIRVSRPGFTPYIDVFKAKQGQVAKLEVELVPISGVLRLAADGQNSRVFIDDRYVGDAPVEAEMDVGQHAVRVERAGFYPENFTVAAVAGQVVDKTVTLKELPPDQNPYLRKEAPPPKWYQKWWVWTIVGAVGVAAIATAIAVPVVKQKQALCNNVDVCVTNIDTTAPSMAGLHVSF
jgi:hypothetical protein